MRDAKLLKLGFTFIAANVFIDVANEFAAELAAAAWALVFPITELMLELEPPDGRFPIIICLD